MNTDNYTDYKLKDTNNYTDSKLKNKDNYTDYKLMALTTITRTIN